MKPNTLIRSFLIGTALCLGTATAAYAGHHEDMKDKAMSEAQDMAADKASVKAHMMKMKDMSDDERKAYWETLSDADKADIKKYKKKAKAKAYKSHKMKMKDMSDDEKKAYWEALSEEERANYKKHKMKKKDKMKGDKKGKMKDAKADKIKGKMKGDKADKMKGEKGGKMHSDMMQGETMQAPTKTTPTFTPPPASTSLPDRPETYLSFDDAVQFCLKNYSSELQGCVDIMTGQR